MAGGVMAFDLSSATGWAVGRLPARPPTMLEAATIRPPQPLSGVERFSGPVGPFLADFESWLTAMLDRHQPAGIIFESPILPAETTPATVMKLMSLAGVLQLVVHRRRIKWLRQAQPSSVKKHFCGSGRKGKDGVLNACRARGWTWETDDEADALALWDYAASIYAAERAGRRH